MTADGSRYTGVVLAAGRGTRIHPLSDLVPKPLLLVCNKPIIQYQIETMRAVGVREIVVVVGHLGEHIRNRFGSGASLGVHLTYVVDENPQGIAHSLALAEGHVSERMIVFLGDIFLDLNHLALALEPMEKGEAQGVVIVKHESDPAAIRRNFAVVLGDGGQVIEVIEKPKEWYNDLKGCGVYVFDRRIFEAIRKTPRSALRNEYELTDAIQVLINMGADIRAAAIVAYEMNVTFPKDLWECNLVWLRRQGLSNLCAPGVRLAPGTELEEAILGEGVEFAGAVTIRQSVIYPYSQVSSPTGLIERSLIFPKGSLSF